MLRQLFHSEIRANLSENRGIAFKPLIWRDLQDICGFRENRSGRLLLEYRIDIYL
ncbi:hypothetical protein ACCUM_2898 [Candidatus Accumulibacter phosphatis]|uniref:Uncharacterized protein n=1 Tax=Candidatus Accumulibacter phosphatis TaxID=327160 RepID=A0A5S4EHP0_9PROT|nr:hypothetical protein ACCUM_2898 [Candidatus Accumulibacter phosphatis]